MKKSIVYLPLLMLVFLAMAPLAHAQSNKKNFGLGVVFGEPTGLSAKLWTSQTNAFDFGLAWSFTNKNSIDMTADYVWNKFNLFDISQGKLPLYYGIGGRLLLGNNAQFGVRIPVGLNYLFAKAPVGIFLEVAPILNLVPSTTFDMSGGIGVRYYFGMK